MTYLYVIGKYFVSQDNFFNALRNIDISVLCCCFEGFYEPPILMEMRAKGSLGLIFADLRILSAIFLNSFLDVAKAVFYNKNTYLINYFGI